MRRSEGIRAREVRDMFGAIASRYDFLNHFLSANIDRRWRQRCVKEISTRLAIPKPRVLDVGCGTADLSISISVLGPVIGCDFCHPMLRVGQAKVTRTRLRHTVNLAEGDALNLPFPTGIFEIVVSAFVARNLASLEKGLQEMRRVLRPGGILGILDFSMPRLRVLGSLYRFYFLRVLPKLGRWVSGVDGPYRYLPESVQTFPSPTELSDRIRNAGFRDVECSLLTQGIAVLFIATADG